MSMRSGKTLSRLLLTGLLAVLLLLVLLFRAPIITEVGGASRYRPEQMAGGLSAGARRIIERAWEGIDPSRLVDYHVHLIGRGAGGSGCSVNPRLFSWRYPVRRIKLEVYASASGIDLGADEDRVYVERLASLARSIPDHGRYLLLAFDRHHLADGSRSPELSEFFTPNGYSVSVAARYPDLFVAAGSVHPLRSDALEELERCARAGVRVIKWLPNAMGIDPADPRCDPYYARMKALGLILLSHAGEEQAVEAEEHQRLGNPLRLRRALDAGVKVLVADCAGLGTNEDLDDPGRSRRSNFELFLRMMEEPRHRGLLFGEISAMTVFSRMDEPFLTLLERPDLWSRLVNGSDYPIPAINVLVQTRALVREGFVTREEREALNEIYDYNPLLFDFVVKLTMRHPETGVRLPAAVFLEHPELAVR